MKSNSSSKSKKSYIFENFLVEQNEKNFFDNYKNDLEDIFEILYNKLGKLPESTNLIFNHKLIQKLISNPIKIKKHKLICKFLNEKIILESTKKENCSVEIKYLKKITIKNDTNLNKVWICNKQIAILLLKEEKYIYIIKNEINEKEYDMDDISLISNDESLEKAIKNQDIIYATKNDIINIDTIGNDIDDNKNFSILSYPYNMSFFLEGPNSMNFPKIKKKPSEIIKIATSINLEDSLRTDKNICYFLYNKKIGMTTKILSHFNYQKADNNEKRNYLYINVDLIKDKCNKISKKKYFAYYLSKLFQDSTSYKTFFQKITPLILDNNKSFVKLIYEIILEFKNYNNNKENYYFLLDNIYSKVIFNELKNEYEDETYYELSNIKNFYFYYFVELNNSTADYLYNSQIVFRFINNDNYSRPQEYIDSLNDPNHENNYLTQIKNNFNEILSKYNNLDKIILVLKIKYLSFLNDFKSETEIINIIKEFSDFFHINCINRNRIKRIEIDTIEFNTNKILDFFNNKFDSMICDYINKNETGIFNVLIKEKTIEGILLEKQIILKLIANLFIKKLDIERIYCCSFEEKDIDKDISLTKFGNIIIVQNQCNAPIYDFGIITIINNEITLKVYQVGINKEKDELDKLDIDIIKLDIEYFIKKIYIHYGIKISQYAFGIITTKEGYDQFMNQNKKEKDKKDENNKKEKKEYFMGENYENKYKNFPIMKQHCQTNSYEFLLFDKNEKKFYSFDNNDELRVVKLMNYFDDKSIINVSDIYKEINFSKLKKMYTNKNEISNILNDIKSTIREEEDISIKVIGKFNYNEKYIPIIKNLFIYWTIKNKKGEKKWLEYNHKIISNNNIKELCFKKGIFYACVIKGIDNSLNKIGENFIIYIPQNKKIKKKKKSKKNKNLNISAITTTNKKIKKNKSFNISTITTTKKKTIKFIGIKRKRAKVETNGEANKNKED